VRWLLLKDLQILRRSPLLVGLLVVYPILIALLLGFALSRGPEKPKVALYSQVPKGQGKLTLGSTTIDASKYADRLVQSVDPIRVHSRRAAIEKVRSGDALAALIIPSDITQKLQSGVERPRVEVIYNNEDPVKGRFVDQVINSQLADANAALSDKFREVALGYINLLLRGGQFQLLGQDLDVLGLRKAKTILDRALADLPRSSALRPALMQVVRFAGLAIDNLDLTDEVLGTVSSPVEVKRVALQGKRTPLDEFAVAVSVTVSLLFVTMLLAAGMLALEREENAFPRLVRGLVSRAGLLVEKIGLATLCAFPVALAMLVGIGLFVGLDWARFPLWLVALAFGALAFAALGVAIGGLAREVRAGSLLAFLLSLPIVFLALVPSGAVSGGLYTVIRLVSAAFPFKPALQATNAALNGADPGLLVPLLHLVVLTVVFGAIGRLSLRRFG